MDENKKREEEATKWDLNAYTHVFTLSADDYAKMMGTKLSDYHPQGIEAFEQCAHSNGCEHFPHKTAKAGLAELCIELGADAVVDVRPGVIPHHTGPYANHDRIYLIGTALIRKTIK